MEEAIDRLIKEAAACNARWKVMTSIARGGTAVLVAALPAAEWTLGSVLKEAGYETYFTGKWHLGDQPKFLPTRQGFDYWLGIPYSDNMDASKKTFHPRC